MSDGEKEEIVKLLESPEFSDSNPNQIVPTLADRGIYLGSESSFYRILKENKMNKHRQSSNPSTNKAPETYIATKPNQGGHGILPICHWSSKEHIFIYIW